MWIMKSPSIRVHLITQQANMIIMMWQVSNIIGIAIDMLFIFSPKEYFAFNILIFKIQARVKAPIMIPCSYMKKFVASEDHLIYTFIHIIKIQPNRPPKVTWSHTLQHPYYDLLIYRIYSWSFGARILIWSSPIFLLMGTLIQKINLIQNLYHHVGTFRLAIWQPVNQLFRDPKWHGPQEELPLVSQFNFLYISFFISSLYVIRF